MGWAVRGVKTPTGQRVAYDQFNNRAVWKCDGCGRLDHWGKGWTWYGSFMDADDGHYEWVACSKECMGKRRPHP